MNENNIQMLDVNFSSRSFRKILKEIEYRINQRMTGSYICVTNTESVFHAQRIKSHLEYINKADFSCCDGVAISLAGKIFWQVYTSAAWA